MSPPCPTIAILSVGQMGLGIASLLLAYNYTVSTTVSGRSAATKTRAASTGIKLLDTDDELVASADYVLSIVPPRDAMRTAERVVSALERLGGRSGGMGEETRGKQGREKGERGKMLYYLELNAISPGTARQIGALFDDGDRVKGQVAFIDGGIIGHPPVLPKTAGPATNAAAPGVDWTRPGLPLSGPHVLPSEHLASLLNSRHISSEIGSASGLKCCFAALTKGFTALALQSFTTASSLGVLPQLQEYMDLYNPGARSKAEKGVVGCTGKAYRWVEEMRQIEECFEGEGGWRGEASVFREIAGVFQGLADMVEKEESVGRMENAEGVVGVLGNHLKKAKISE